MKRLSLAVASVALLVPAPSHAGKAAAAFVAFIYNCAGATTEQEWNSRSCGPGAGDFAIKPELRKYWRLEKKWIEMCQAEADQHCTAMNRQPGCSAGIIKADRGDPPECFLQVPAAGRTLRHHCGSIANQHCIDNGLPGTCTEGIQKVHSGNHPECDF